VKVPSELCARTRRSSHRRVRNDGGDPKAGGGVGGVQIISENWRPRVLNKRSAKPPNWMGTFEGKFTSGNTAV